MKIRKKFIIIFLFILLFVFGGCYTYFLRPVVDDEFYIFGFASNILEGKIPYLDFNMIIPPFFPYFVSLFLRIFGKYLIVYHFLLALIVVAITYLSYKKIGLCAIGIYALILIYPYIGYNLFCLFLFMLILYFDDMDIKHKDVIEAVIICMMFLTKQTLGILIIPSIVFSKNKKKIIAIYLVGVLVLFLYLICFHNINSFFDYCFFGMFDFASKNGRFSSMFLEEFVVIFILSILLIKTKQKKYIYILCFQVIVFPIADYAHFVIGFVPVTYLLFYYFHKKLIFSVSFTTFLITYFIIFSCSILFSPNYYHFLGYYSNDGFMKGRLTYLGTSQYISDINSYLKQYSDDQVFILGSFSYLVKLNLDLPINCYDIINDGNMGYGGYEKYISNIDDTCSHQKCMFVINDQEAMGKVYNQVNRDILLYVQREYNQRYSSSSFSIYTN